MKPHHFQRLVDRVAGSAVERPVALLMLRTMQQARYDTGNVGHFGLAAPVYTHFTSPIRRYPDLVVHRLLREARAGAMSDARRDALEAELPEIAAHASQPERRAAEPERELAQWKKVRFMADRVGEEFDGYVTGVSAFGLFVAVLVGVLAVFWPTVRGMIEIWNESGHFTHGWLVIPAVVWFAWERRQRLVAIALRPFWPGLLVVAAGGIVWLAANVAGVGSLRKSR